MFSDKSLKPFSPGSIASPYNAFVALVPAEGRTGQMLTILKVYVWLYASLVIDFYYSVLLSFLCSRDHSFCSFPYLLASHLNGLSQEEQFYYSRNLKRTYRRGMFPVNVRLQREHDNEKNAFHEPKWKKTFAR